MLLLALLSPRAPNNPKRGTVGLSTSLLSIIIKVRRPFRRAQPIRSIPIRPFGRLALMSTAPKSNLEARNHRPSPVAPRPTNHILKHPPPLSPTAHNARRPGDQAGGARRARGGQAEHPGRHYGLDGPKNAAGGRPGAARTIGLQQLPGRQRCVCVEVFGGLRAGPDGVGGRRGGGRARPSDRPRGSLWMHGHAVDIVHSPATLHPTPSQTTVRCDMSLPCQRYVRPATGPSSEGRVLCVGSDLGSDLCAYAL